MSESKYIAIDLGAGNGRVICGSLRDKKLRIKEYYRFLNKQVIENNHLHWNLKYLFNEIIDGIKKIDAETLNKVESVGIDTWGVDYGFLDKNGSLIKNPYTYRDRRTDGMMDEVFSKVSKKKIYEKTGIQFLKFNTLFQLQWDLLKGLFSSDQIKSLLFIPDLLYYFLTGEISTEITIASTSQIMNAETKEWDSDILRSLKIPHSIMPKIKSPTSSINIISNYLQKQKGLPSLEIIKIASHDTASAVAAVPTTTNTWAYISSGTWSLIGIETTNPIINDDTFKFGFTNEAGVEGTNRLLKNTMGLWVLEQAIIIWKKKGLNYNYKDLLEKAEKANPFSFIIDPDHQSFLNPENMIDTINKYCRVTNQSKPKTQGDYVRGILESLSLKYKYYLNQIQEISSIKIDVLHIVGGGSQNKLLNQFTANALGISVIAGPVEATAIGNIIMQAIAKGAIDNIKQGREIVRDSFVIDEYKPKNINLWQAVYKKAFELYSI